MKTILFIFLLVLPSISTNAQTPQVGTIDFYGLRNVTVSQARAALQIKEGDDLTEQSKEAMQKRLEALPNVEQAQVSAICCEAGKLSLYVGIREKGAPTLQVRAAPTGTVRLTGEIIKAGEDFSAAHRSAILKGDAGEDMSFGHSLMNNREGRAAQERFIPIAAQNLKLLRRVLRESSDAEHRSLAAQIIAYSKDKKDIVKDLVYGIGDPDEGVRNDSMRALTLLARFAIDNPKEGIKVPFEPFVEMLNSIEWTDRNKSSFALMQLTEKRDASLLSLLRKRAFSSLVEMARWKSNHAIAPFFVLARVGNISDEEIQKFWAANNREILIETILKKVD